MTKYSLTIEADSPEALDDILRGGGTAKPQDEAALLRQLQELLDAQGKTVVIRAKRNSKATKTVEPDPKPEDEGDEGDDEGPDVDFDTAVAKAKAAVHDKANPKLAARVKKALSAVMANMNGVKKTSEITSHEDQERFVLELAQAVPALFEGEDEAEPEPEDENEDDPFA